MKLKVKNGVSIEKALEYIKTFLEENYGEYSVLKSDLNLYVTLRDIENRSCPDNEKEFVLSADNIVDVEQENISKKKEELYEGWKNYYKAQAKNIYKKEKDVEFANSNLNAAIKKNLTEKTIEQRKRALKSAESDFEKAESFFKLVVKIASLIEDKKYRIYIVQSKNKSSYTYNLEAYYIFKNVDGHDFYFAEYMSRYDSPYGKLYEGVPQGFSE